MAGRRRTYTRPCTTSGCREVSQIEYTSRRDLEGISKTWTCRHHSRPNETLSLTNRETTAVLALHAHYANGYRAEEPPRLIGHFWGPEDAEKGSHGIVSGPGFWADAKNFPPGARLTVTSRVELPDESGTDPRQTAYDAVFAYIRSQPVDFLPTTVVGRNAMIWHAVHAALDAVGIPGSAEQED